MQEINNFVIITGTVGAGKTTLINKLEENHHCVVPEPARKIISEQIAVDGDGIYERNPGLFTELLL